MSEIFPETPGQARREDWFAVLAFAAYTDRPNASEAFAAWQHLSERKRVNWRATVDAVRMAVATQEPHAAPELAAELAEARELRKVIAEMLGMFRAVSGGWGARTSSSRLRKLATRAGVTWDEYGRRDAPDTDEAAETTRLRKRVLDLAAKWDATAARNQRNGQSLIDQGDEYGNEGLAVAEALGACVIELRHAAEPPS